MKNDIAIIFGPCAIAFGLWLFFTTVLCSGLITFFR